MLSWCIKVVVCAKIIDLVKLLMKLIVSFNTEQFMNGNPE